MGGRGRSGDVSGSYVSFVSYNNKIMIINLNWYSVLDLDSIPGRTSLNSGPGINCLRMHELIS